MTSTRGRFGSRHGGWGFTEFSRFTFLDLDAELMSRLNKLPSTVCLLRVVCLALNHSSLRMLPTNECLLHFCGLFLSDQVAEQG